MTLDMLMAALATLPRAVRQRAAHATLLRTQDYDEDEIAAALGVNRRTLHRDRLALQVAVLDASGLSADEFARDYRIHVPNSARDAKNEAK